jgi:hypothetical protein
MSRRQIDWTGNPEDGPHSETIYYRYVRALDGQLVPVDVVKRNGRLVPRFPPEAVEPSDLCADSEPPFDLERLDRYCSHLNEMERRRFLLAGCDGKSISDIARTEGVTRQAVIDSFHRMADKNGYVNLFLESKNKKNQYE